MNNAWYMHCIWLNFGNWWDFLLICFNKIVLYSYTFVPHIVYWMIVTIVFNLSEKLNIQVLDEHTNYWYVPRDQFKYYASLTALVLDSK